MKLEDQVVSLELAKRLKELGVKQESLFYWWLDTGSDFKDEPSANYGKPTPKENGGWWDEVSAFTVAELGEMLPKYVGDDAQYFLECYKTDCTPNKSGYQIRYSENQSAEYCLHAVMENTEADARAKMLIYLLENGLITN